MSVIQSVIPPPLAPGLIYVLQMQLLLHLSLLCYMVAKERWERREWCQSSSPSVHPPLAPGLIYVLQMQLLLHLWLLCYMVAKERWERREWCQSSSSALAPGSHLRCTDAAPLSPVAVVLPVCQRTVGQERMVSLMQFSSSHLRCTHATPLSSGSRYRFHNCAVARTRTKSSRGRNRPFTFVDVFAHPIKCPACAG